MSVTWTGMEELKAALKTLPADLTDDATDAVFGSAEAAAAEIIARYPRRTGDLKKGVRVTRSKGRTTTSATVKNTAFLANIFEKGTEARHYLTDNGVKHLTGKMPPGHVFLPVIIRRRRWMYEQLKDVLVRAGLLVSGDA